MRRLLFLALWVPFLFAGTAVAQTTLFLVRHAETAGPTTGGQDPDLSDAGRARADRLAAALKDVGIGAVFATEYRRTQQTAAPVARLAGLEVTVVPAAEPAAALAARLQALPAGKNALVVGHSNTLPEIAKALGVPPKSRSVRRISTIFSSSSPPLPLPARVRNRA